MPWLLGALLANALWVIVWPNRLTTPVFYPEKFRRGFIVVIAVMIGGTFTPALVTALPKWWPSFIAMIVYTVICHAMAYAVYRKFARIDRATAFFAASPGGLVESIILGEEAGGDEKLIATLHFVRLSLVVAIVPFGFSIWEGHAVGSASGAAFGASSGGISLYDAFLLTTAGLSGYLVCRFLRIPAGIIFGPMVFSGALHVSGVTDAQVPAILGIIAQVFVGTGIGVRFSGMRAKTLVWAFGLCGIAVTLMLTVVLLFAVVLAPLTDVDGEVYIASFAPAGVIEMSLIALTLGANPVFVTTHHVLRLLTSVTLMPLVYNRFLAKQHNASRKA